MQFQDLGFSKYAQPSKEAQSKDAIKGESTPNLNAKPTVVDRLALSEDVHALTLRLTSHEVNTILIYSKKTKSGFLVDPGGEGEKILKVAKDLNIKIEKVLLTHSHPDHCAGVWYVKEMTGAKLLGSSHKFEVFLRKNVESILNNIGRPERGMRNCPALDEPLNKKSEILIGDLKFQVLKTPGHSPGHLSYYCESAKILIAGDLYFNKQFAPTDIRGGDAEVFRNTFLRLKAIIPPDVLCICGHGRNIHMRDWRVPN
jgi:hydroxyacylglutathione hydrolase